jgi:hypothetical protein
MHTFGLRDLNELYDYRTAAVDTYGVCESYGYTQNYYGGNLRFIAKTKEPVTYFFLDGLHRTLDVGVDDLETCDPNIIRLAIKAQCKKQAKTNSRDELIKIYRSKK